MMEKMKPSGIAWIGDIPTGWKVKKIKYYTYIVNGSTPDSSDLNCWDGPIKWITPADMDNTGIIYEGERTLTQYGYNSCGTSMLPKGSVVVSSRAPIGKINITGDVLCTNQGCKSLVGETDNRYLYYLLLAGQEELVRLGRGTTFVELSTHDLSNFGIVLPESAERTAIADFLDTQCTKIDSVIADIEKQIETLQKYKKSLITEMVTKGLDRSVPMKDSGIEWIGEIPKHWGISKTRYLANLCSGATPSKDVYSYWEGNIPWVSSQEVKTDIITDTSLHISEESIHSCSTKLMPAGTLVMVVRSGILQHTIPVALLGVPATINQDIKAFVFKAEMIPAYYKYYIQGENDALLNVLIKDKTTVESIDNNLLLSLRIMVPPIQEQKDIVSYLDERCGKINSIIADKRAQLDTIIQHKKSLIYEYVTGKKRVTEVN